MPTVDFQIFGSVAKGNTTSFYFRPYNTPQQLLHIPIGSELTSTNNQIVSNQYVHLRPL